MSPQLMAAFERALWTAIPAAAMAALAVYATTEDWKPVIVAGLTAFFTPFVTRGAGEGSFDTLRNARGDVTDADVGSDIPGLDAAPALRVPRPPVAPRG